MGNTNVKDPTPCQPFQSAAPSLRTGCTRTDLVDISSEIKRSLQVNFTFSAPEQNYAVLLTEGSDDIWEIDYVENGEIKRCAGKVRAFEYWTNKHIAPTHYSINGTNPVDSKTVVKFDCSIDYRSLVVDIDVRNLRRIKPMGLIEEQKMGQDSTENYIVAPRNAYNFSKNLYGTMWESMTEYDVVIDTRDVVYADFMFDGGVNLLKLPIIDFDKVKSANRAFRGLEKLELLNISTTDALKSAVDMFNGCKLLKKITVETKNVTDARGMFYNCSSLETLNLDVSNLSHTEAMFNGCKSLVNINITPGTLDTGLDLSDCPLTTESVQNILENGLNKDKNFDPNRVLVFRNVKVPNSLVSTVKDLNERGWKILNLTYET